MQDTTPEIEVTEIQVPTLVEVEPIEVPDPWLTGPSEN